MRLIYSLIFLFILLSGGFIAIKSYNHSKAIFWGIEGGYKPAFINSALAGLSLSLLMFGGVFFVASIADSSYPLEFNSLVRSFSVFLIPGFVIFLGSLWQYFMVGLYRDPLLRFIKNRNDAKNKK